MGVRATFLMIGILAAAVPAAAWNLDLPDTLWVDGGPVTLQELALGPVPAAAADLVVHGGGRPNTTVELTRQGLLRRLVDAGLARQVRLGGAERSVLVFDGRNIATEELADAVRREIRPFVPSGPVGAPASWIEIDLPSLDLATEGEWSVSLTEDPRLEPGRNLVACRLRGGTRTESFSVVVDLHVYAEIATARTDLARDTVLDPAAFGWSWRDLAEVPPGRVAGRESLSGVSLVRDLKSGDELRQSDLAPTPVVRAGEAVDLTIRRGSVVVTVRAVARQPGSAGQTIPVRNEVTGRLVNALVAGPGRVEWRR